MKLTEARLKQIILEELNNIQEKEAKAEEEPKQPEQSGEKLQSDVEVVKKQIDAKIDNVKEYSELVQLISKHDFGNENQKLRVLRQLRDMINQLLR